MENKNLLYIGLAIVALCACAMVFGAAGFFFYQTTTKEVAVAPTNTPTREATKAPTPEPEPTEAPTPTDEPISEPEADADAAESENVAPIETDVTESETAEIESPDGDEVGLTANGEDDNLLQILSMTDYVNDSGWLYIVGEVQNNAENGVEFIEVSAYLYDADDNIIHSETTYVYRDIIPSGETSPFEVYFDEFEGAERYEVIVEGDETLATPTTGLEIVAMSDYMDGDYMYIVGEIQNTTDQPFDFVEIIGTLYNDDGEVVSTGFAYSELDIIAPDETSPFSLFIDNSDEISSYNIVVDGEITDELPRTDLVVLNSEDYIDDIGFFNITGEIQNQGDTDSEFVQIVAAFYDAEGNIAGVDFTFADTDPLLAGETSTFELFTSNRDVFDSYVLYVQGD